jgi:hypothetical protein
VDTDVRCRFQTDAETEHLYGRLNAYLRNNPRRIEEDIERFESLAAQQGLLYGGRPLSIGFYPIILSHPQLTAIMEVVEALLGVMEKITRLFLHEPSVRRMFGFPREQVELIEVDPGYEPAIPCGRFDSFFDGRHIRFTEFNTDGTAGMDGAEKITKLFMSLPSIQEFFSGCPPKTFDINQCVLQAILDCHRQFVGGKPPVSPRIAITDWKEARTSAEFVAFREFCHARGYEAVVADPREFSYDGTTLSHRGLKIDIIYRRVVSSEYVGRLEEVGDMTRAFKDHAVCVVGSFRSDVAFSKKAFAFLHQPEFSHLFSAEEHKLVERHIPWTQRFEDAECEYRGERTRLPDLARDNKDAFVLKPSNLYEGQGVWLGAKKTSEEWQELIDTALEEDYVLQELLSVPCLPVGIWQDGFEMQERFVHLGEYVFGGNFCGLYCRTAEGPLINRASRERLAPCLVLAQRGGTYGEEAS